MASGTIQNLRESFSEACFLPMCETHCFEIELCALCGHPLVAHQCVSQFWGHTHENTQWKKAELCARPVTQCGPPVCVTGDRASITDDQLGCSAWAIISIACHNIARAQCIEQRKAAQSRGGEERGEQHSGARCEDYLIGRLVDELWKHLSLLSSHCPLPPLGYLSILPACHPPGWKKNENAL